MFEYRYKTDLKTRYLTVVHFIVFAIIAATLCILVDGGYILAWFISVLKHLYSSFAAWAIA